MRVGQTSFVVFASRLVSAALGFLATVYFARFLGAEVLGYYAVVVALAGWLQLGGRLGISSAVTKRISEGNEADAYVMAGAISVAAIAVIFLSAVLLFADPINNFIGSPVALFVGLLFLSGLFYQYVNSILQGQRLVHIAGVLDPVKTASRSLLQVGLVAVGFGLGGLLFGYAAGGILVGTVGILYLTVGISLPKRRHFRSLFDFAKYSFLGGLRDRSFSDVDLLVLAALVSPALVGVYSIVWSIANFLTIFGKAMSGTLFPEISRAEATDDTDQLATLISDSLTYGGLLTIPGVFGGIILGDRLLRIYGEEFIQGTTVLGLLLMAVLLYGYQKQLLNALNAYDRPDIAFRINVVFITTNLLLNIAFVYVFGWIGAAVATVLSSVLGLFLSYRSVCEFVDFILPIEELSKQFMAAAAMAAVVSTLRELVEITGAISHNVLIVVTLVVVGVGIYFLTLLMISEQFRITVITNVPDRML